MSESEVSRVLGTVNQQVIEDFVPIWGAGYECILINSLDSPSVDCETYIYLVDELEGYEPPDEAGDSYYVVSSQFGDLAVTLSHQVFELIVSRGKY